MLSDFVVYNWQKVNRPMEINSVIPWSEKLKTLHQFL